jgi:S-DNA-T family DNA segregation ATPase FtsK/SpoIIIE
VAAVPAAAPAAPAAAPIDLVADDLAARTQAVEWHDGSDDTGSGGDDGEDAWSLTGR